MKFFWKKEGEEKKEKKKKEISPKEDVATQEDTGKRKGKKGKKGEASLDVNEQIEDLRSSFLESEKSMQELLVKTEQATELIAEVKPEKQMEEIQKLQAAIEELRTKIDIDKHMLLDIFEKQKKDERTIRIFRGVNHVTKLTEKMQKELDDMEKMRRMIEVHADRIEKNYMDFQKRYLHFKRYKEILKETQHLVVELKKEINELRNKRIKYAEKDELEDLLKNIHTGIGQYFIFHF